MEKTEIFSKRILSTKYYLQEFLALNLFENIL